MIWLHLSSNETLILSLDLIYALIACVTSVKLGLTNSS